MPTVDPSSKKLLAAAIITSTTILSGASRVAPPVSDHAPVHRSQVPRPNGVRRRALIIEDEPAVANVAQKGLEGAGFTVEAVRTGADGTLRMVQGSFDVVLLDWRLGDMTGGEVLRIIRGAGLAVPVIVLSGYDERDAALSLGANAFERKPFRMAAMIPLIERLLSGEPNHVGDVGRQVFSSWTVRVLTLIDSVSRTLVADAARLDLATQRTLLRQLGHALADADATIPEFRAGCAAFKLIVHAKVGANRLVLAEARRLMAMRRFDRAGVHEKVLRAVDYFESAARDAQPIREGLVGHDVGTAPAWLGALLKDQTGLKWDDWSTGAHLRDSARGIVAGCRGLGASAVVEWGWSSRHHFYVMFRKLVGVGPDRFRSIVAPTVRSPRRRRTAGGT